MHIKPIMLKLPAAATKYYPQNSNLNQLYSLSYYIYSFPLFYIPRLT